MFKIEKVLGLAMFAGMLLVGCDNVKEVEQVETTEVVEVQVQDEVAVDTVDTVDTVGVAELEEVIINQTSNMEETASTVTFYYNGTTEQFMNGITSNETDVIELLMLIGTGSSLDVDREYSILNNTNDVIIAYQNGIATVNNLK